MKQFVRTLRLSPAELGLYLGSVALIVSVFFGLGCKEYLYLASSLMGATALIYLAKAHPMGQLLSVIFAGFYGDVAYTYAYHGEMITYLGMTGPMALASLIAWIRHPYRDSGEVEVRRLSPAEWGLMGVIAGGVTVAFYFILKALHTHNLALSTLSILTSFIPVYLTMRRSPWYALGYAVNDVVLIALWSLAARDNVEYLSMVLCFVVFLVNDGYGLFRWLRRQALQASAPAVEPADLEE